MCICGLRGTLYLFVLSLDEFWFVMCVCVRRECMCLYVCDAHISSFVIRAGV